MNARRERERLDLLLVRRGLAASRAEAQRRIMAGEVLVDDRVVDKAGSAVPVSAALRLRGDANPFVSRGGLKLAGALEALALAPAGVWADFGASTGGFTDCLLQQGVTRVYAIDVGYGQLADKLRRDARVVVMERTNARHLSAADLPEKLDGVVIDASFISLRHLLPSAHALLKPGARLLAMAKPQFEAGQARLKGGVVRDEALRLEVLAEVREALHGELFAPLGECSAPLRGPKGNLEHFFLAEAKLL